MKNLIIFVSLCLTIFGLGCSCQTEQSVPAIDDQTNVVIEQVGMNWLVLTPGSALSKTGLPNEAGSLFLKRKPRSHDWKYWSRIENGQIHFLEPYQLMECGSRLDHKMSYLILDTIKNMPRKMNVHGTFWNEVEMRNRLIKAYLHPGNRIYYTYDSGKIRYSPRTLWIGYSLETPPEGFVVYRNKKMIIGEIPTTIARHTNALMPIFLIFTLLIPVLLKLGRITLKIERSAVSIWVIINALLIFHYGHSVGLFRNPAETIILVLASTGFFLAFYLMSYRVVKLLTKEPPKENPKTRYQNQAIAIILANVFIFAAITDDIRYAWLPLVLGGLGLGIAGIIKIPIKK